MSTSNNKRATPPPEIVSGGGVDLFSHLPDAILITIISLLPFKEGARTTIISSRFRHLWSKSTLNLCALSLLPLRQILDDENAHIIIDAIDRILTTSHSGPIHSFRLFQLSFSSIGARIDRWLETLAQRGVQKLHLWNNGNHYSLPPCSLFSSTNPTPSSLQDLKLWNCGPSQGAISFPKLRALSFSRSYLSEESLAALLSNCPVLEDLSISFCGVPKKIRISSQSLRVFALESPSWNAADYIVIEDVPNLEQLLLGQNVTKVTCVRILDAPKLEVFGLINARVVKGIELCKTRLQYIVPSTLRTLMCGVRKIAISMDFHEHDQTKMAYDLLKCFPCLETLDMVVKSKAPHPHDDDLEYWEQQDSLDCLNLHLKRVNLVGSIDEDTPVGFARFLVMKACVLEVMTIFPPSTSIFLRLKAQSMLAKNGPSRMWEKILEENIPSRTWAETLRGLCLENSASPEAQVVFSDEMFPGDRLSTWRPLLVRF